MEKNTLKEMFDNLLHIGNKKSFWNPRMRNYIYGESNGVHIINLIETDKKIEEVKAYLNEVTKQGKKILFVTTKIQGKDAFKKLAKDTGNYYVDEKWVPGLLTNFKTIKRRISTYLRYLKDQEIGAFETLTKKEKAGKLLELEKLEKSYGGLKDMKKVPDLLFVVDGVYESQAIKEAQTLGIDCIAILNTNGDDYEILNCIPANTNSPKSLQYIADALRPSIVIGGNAQTQAKTSNKTGSNIKKMEKKPASGLRKPSTRKTAEKTEKPTKEKSEEK